MKLKKSDQIIVLAGKDKGQKGKIEKVFPKSKKVLVAGVNIYKRHRRPRGEKQPGGIIDVVKPLPVSSVALLCPKCNQATRVGFRLDPNGQKYRICRKCQQVI